MTNIAKPDLPEHEGKVACSDEPFQEMAGHDPFSLPVELSAAIGRLCNEWARLEREIAFFFAESIGLSRHDALTAAIVPQIKLRDQIACIKIAASLSFKDRIWVDGVIDAIDYIDGKLRTIRNRYVHDTWQSELLYKHPVKFDASTKSLHSKQIGERGVSFGSVRETPISAVEECEAVISSQRQFIHELIRHVEALKSGDMESPLPERPQRLHEDRLQEKPDQRQQARPKQKQPRQSPQK